MIIKKYDNNENAILDWIIFSLLLIIGTILYKYSKLKSITVADWVNVKYNYIIWCLYDVN